MIDNKKSGIRLRHLQQGAEEPKKRDVSPGNPNRKKIFDYNNRKTSERQFQEEHEPRRVRIEENSSDYEELIDNLKKKTMEVELRDEAIKYLNKQIQDLKSQLKLKDKEIGRLNQEISLLQKAQSAPKRQTLPFKASEVSSFSYLGDNKLSNNSFQTNNQNAFKDKNLHEEISLSNLNYKRQSQQKFAQAEILSPFMALHPPTSQNFNKYDQKRPANTGRVSAPQDYNYQQNSTDYSGFLKKRGNNEFDFNQDDSFPNKRPSMVDSVNKQLQKFNIFADPQSKREIFARSKLQIQDSRQFKFQQAEKGFGGYNPSTF